MGYIIDRFEGDLALCEGPDRSILSIPRSQLPQGAKEGDVLEEKEGVYLLSPTKTQERKAAIHSKMSRLLKK